MKLIAQYEEAIHRGEIEEDPLQKEIVQHMQRLTDELAEPLTLWYSWRKKKIIKGLYIYGPVGVGKTYLVDLFFNYVEETKKARFHFHHFMQQIDLKLRQLQGNKNPLQQIAKELAKSIRLLCFDEFLVHDVAYAMILAELFQALESYGVILVISSNTKPDDLYLNGVQRDRFLPAIVIIKQNCEVLSIIEQRDYRLGRLPLLNVYLHPLNSQTEKLMDHQFELLSSGQEPLAIEINGSIIIQNRIIPFIKKAQRTIWFAFDVICNLPRSQLDYLEIAEQFDNVFLSGIPCLTVNHTLQAIMFIHFIDVMYDRGINIIISASVPVGELYLEGEMKEPFKRTLSRLIEMQSVDYLARHPRRSMQKII
jgi:cell division protein ZapE